MFPQAPWLCTLGPSLATMKATARGSLACVCRSTGGWHGRSVPQLTPPFILHGTELPLMCPGALQFMHQKASAAGERG